MIDLIKNKYGYYEVKNKPSKEELEEYYSKKYYQNEAGSYQKEYSKDELDYFKNKLKEDYFLVEKYSQSNVNKSLLDIGSGEGFTLKFYKDKNWNVVGLDFSRHGCKLQNPDCIEDVIVGDIYSKIDELIHQQKKYDLINMQHLLEHVIDPEELMNKIKKLLKKDGLVSITVPNDFSPIQNIALDRGKIRDKFWIVVPDHLSYFNKEGLKKFLTANGFKILFLKSSFPIDIFLLNDHSNYVINKSLGKQAHYARLIFEELINNNDREKINHFYHILSEFGIGRDLKVLATLS